MTTSPEFRALIKIVVFLATSLAAAALVVLAVTTIGLQWTGVALAAVVLIYVLHLMYSIELDRQRRLDQLNKD
jgi:membrane protein implicated in regulation of membrane protease activity